MNMKKVSLVLTGLVLSSAASAGLINDGTWSGWNVFSSEDKEGNFNYVAPGFGGQSFDAEHLLYKRVKNTLYIGLQTGFDVVTGTQVYGNDRYWSGDIGLSFNGAVVGDSSTYEYAIDFGLGQCGWSQHGNNGCGANNDQGLNDAAGVYAVDTWNNDVYNGHHVSDPFAMSTSTDSDALLLNAAGQSGDSFYRQVAIDLAALGLADAENFDAHWTMSCGNDAIDGHAKIAVAEPSSLALLGLGFLCLSILRKR